jgi:Helix-turn-helix domain
MRLFYRLFGHDSAMCQWIWEQDPYDSGFLRGIYDDAFKSKGDRAQGSGTKKAKRVNPDVLTNDAAPEFFAQVPGWLAKDTSVSPTAFRLYVLLLLRAGKKSICWPSQELLASEIGLQPRQLREHLKDLEDKKWITVQRRRNKPSIYQVNHTVKNCRS